MKKSLKQRRKSASDRLSFLRRIRTPLLSVLSVMLVCFVLLPTIFQVKNPIVPVWDIGFALAREAEVTPAPTPTAGLQVSTQTLPDQATYLSLSEPEAPVSTEPTPSQYPTLQFGDTNPLVKDIQLRLMELSYLDGDELTEYFGPATQAGLKLFQRAHYMTETGVGDALTLSILFSDGAAPYMLEYGNSGTDVMKLQKQLTDLGYYADKLNGYFGTATKRALVAFQVKNKVDESGVANSQTLDMLYSSRAKPKIDPTPTPTPKPTPKPTSTPKPAASTAPGTTAAPSTSTPKPLGGSNSGGSAPMGQNLDLFIQIALAQEGKPYVYSAEGPDSYDCSGLVHYALNQSGTKVGRMSAKNFATISSWETITSSGSLRRGDLVFFTNSVGASSIGHTGIYLGNNKFIHASSSAGKVVISTWSPWCADNFQWGKRVF